MVKLFSGRLRPRRRDPWWQLAYVGIILVMVLGVWFSASAVVPALTRQWNLSQGDAAWLTNAVQLGFVVGALLSASLNLADVLSVRRLIGGSALLSAASTAAVPMYVHSPGPAIALRFATGITLAGVYPPGMKVIASWFTLRRGFAIGVLVGALTLGSGSPHLINASANVPWKTLLWISAGIAFAGGLLALVCIRDGPFARAAPRISPAYCVGMFRDRSQRLVNFGYFGHMWELYAVWTWLPAYIAASLGARGHSGSTHTATEVIAFCAIGVAGLLGAVVGGIVADRVGRARLTIGALAGSGACCALSPLIFGQHPIWLVCVCLWWGATVIADSAQFSAALSETADPHYIGTALTVQTAVGFLVTVGSIRLVLWLSSEVGWRWAFLPLAIGPLLGMVSMSAWRRIAPTATPRVAIG